MNMEKVFGLIYTLTECAKLARQKLMHTHRHTQALADAEWKTYELKVLTLAYLIETILA